jgi:hypothetical protein
MLVRIKDNKAEVLQETHVEEKHSACLALDRVKDELAGFMEYKQLNKHSPQSRYALASEQEFQHMLLALDDFFASIIPELSVEEHAELVKFFKAATPSM